MTQVGNYVFTLNNYTTDEVTAVMGCIGNLIRYVIFGFECSESGTLHLQGYVECARSTRVAALKKVEGFERAHFEPRFGSQDQAIEYCKKDGEWYEYGEKKLDRKEQSGNLMQQRLIEVQKAITAGASEEEIFMMDPVVAVQHRQWIKEQRMKVKPIRIKNLEVYLFIGKPGHGKTRLAKHIFPNIYDPPIGKDLWFDHYYREPQVLIDDFSGNIRLVDALRLFDLYAIKVPVKHGFQWFCPEIIIITSNVHPSKWWNYTEREDSAYAIHRRIKHVWDFDNIVNGRPSIIEPDVYWYLAPLPAVPQIDFSLFQPGSMEIIAPPIPQAILDDIDNHLDEAETVSDEDSYEGIMEMQVVNNYRNNVI